MSSTMGTTPHPDDPRDLRSQFMRTYPLIICEPNHTNYAAIAGNNARTWRPACWHKPLDRWWGEGGGPLLSPPVEERWPTFGPGEARESAARLHDIARHLAAEVPSLYDRYSDDIERLARLHAESRARAAARHTDPWEREG